MNANRSDLVPFLLDVLDFVVEQIECARSDADRGSAIDAASGAIPVLKSRAWENRIIGAMIALSPLEIWTFSPRWREHWHNLAKESFDQFGKSADALVEDVKVVKEAISKFAEGV